MYTAKRRRHPLDSHRPSSEFLSPDRRPDSDPSPANVTFCVTTVVVLIPGLFPLSPTSSLMLFGSHPATTVTVYPGLPGLSNSPNSISRSILLLVMPSTPSLNPSVLSDSLNVLPPVLKSDALAVESAPPLPDLPKGVRLALPPLGPLLPVRPLDERSREPKRRGMAWTRMGRRVGRQTAMTPTESSRKEKVAASTLSQLASFESLTALRVLMR